MSLALNQLPNLSCKSLALNQLTKLSFMDIAIPNIFMTPEAAPIRSALERIKAELERKEQLFQEQWELFEFQSKERVTFIEASEAKLAAKLDAYQDRQLELEQKQEDLRALERHLKEREAAIDPVAAAALAAKKFDPFVE